ncbi:MAG TPA: hypothetical protein VNV85_10435 [Puia sp.]|jgi:hypothetical protein|nr:hypothetical protein [Puia sp.]
MSANSAKISKFQINFLKFLNEKTIEEVHIYYHIMNYWSNDQSEISLQELKEAVTDLCNEKLILSKNNAHLSIGVLGIPEDDQKNNAVCTILDAGRIYLKRAELKRNVKFTFIVLLVIAAFYSTWHYRIFSYFFR